MAKSREKALNAWARDMIAAEGLDAGKGFSLEPASDDASFRRYFRGRAGDASFVFMDAPPELEDSKPFVNIAHLLRDAGVKAPRIYQQDLAQGFLMLSDFGDRLYLDEVAQSSGQVPGLYDAALATVIRMQKMSLPDWLEPYDEHKLRIEMNLFTDWFLPRQLRLETSPGIDRLIDSVFDTLVTSALSQPARFVHRDYHSRNLMVLEGASPGVIDFQDGVVGPVTYDLVSLLKDCYHRFPVEEVRTRVEQYRLMLHDAGIVRGISTDHFTEWFDLMGMQRHIKVAGIFSRLNLRDGKPGYLADIPLVVDYIVEVCGRYEALSAFGDWLQSDIVPKLDAAAFKR